MENTGLSNAQQRITQLEKQLRSENQLTENKTSNYERYQMRLLEKDDYHKGFLQILNQLSTVGDISEEQFHQRFEEMQNTQGTYYTMVIEDLKEKTIVATATLVVEKKFLRQCSSCGHIEDVVVNSEVRGQNLGKRIILGLKKLAEEKNCYKVILDCSDSNVAFYEKCGFSKTEIMMRYPPKK
eukprot:gene1148-10662_t